MRTESPVYCCRTCDEWLFQSTDLEERANFHTSRGHSFAVVPDKHFSEAEKRWLQELAKRAEAIREHDAEQRARERLRHTRSPQFQFWMACAEFRYQVICALRIREALDWLTAKLTKIRRNL